MFQKRILNQKELKSQIKYEPLTGNFYRIARPKGSSTPMGLIITKPTDAGYIRIRVLGNKYMAHRLACLYMLGIWPDQIDHDDQNRANNKWINLNLATNAINAKNKSLNKRNNTGTPGVIWNKKRKRFIARITHNYKDHWLGQFKTIEEAIQARTLANIKFNFHKNNGKSLCKYRK